MNINTRDKKRKRKEYKSYPLKFKQRCLNQMKTKINEKTNKPLFNHWEQVLDVPRLTLMAWYEAREKIENSKCKSSRRRIRSEKSRAKFIVMEEQLDDWIKEQRENGTVLCSFAIKVKAGTYFN